MPPKKELKKLDFVESDTDSDYSPKTLLTAKRKKQARGVESPSASDTDSGRKKRKKNNQGIDVEEVEQLNYSDIICQTHKLNNVDVDIPDEYLSDINYKQFNKLVRPVVSDANPKVSGLHVTSLVGAKWREFKELYGINLRSDTPDIDRVKHAAGSSPSSEFEKESMPTSPDSVIIQESGDGSEEDDFLDDDSSNDLKLKMVRRGNKLFRAGDRKTSRQSKKTARQGIVNLDDINLDDISREEADETSQETVLKKKPGPKKRTGPRIKNTKDKKEKRKAKTLPQIGKRGPYKKAVKKNIQRKHKPAAKGMSLKRKSIVRINSLKGQSTIIIKKEDSDSTSKNKKNVIATRRKDEPVPEPVHNSVCDVCGEGGDILLCDTCTCSWHLACLDPPLDEVPEGLWSCPKCEAEMTGQMEEEEDDDTFHGEYCKICKDGGELLCCDFCPGTYHMKCVKPQLISVPDGEWQCPMCKVDPLPEKVERILFWKFLTHHPTKEEIDAGAKNESYKVRKFFVKYANLSYWKCHWIDELQLEKYHVSLYRFFCRKNDMNDPPMTEEGLVEGGEDTNVDEVEHQRNLDQRFFQYGIKPEWLQIHRILWHNDFKKTKEMQYLVKWKEIGYDYATWEFKNDLDNKDVLDFDKAIESYNKLRLKCKKKAKLKGKEKAGKRRDGWEYDIRPNGYNAVDQPRFITETGGKLHEYQVEGINWIRYSWGRHDNTILADEMGLGKTIQTITFLNSLWKEGRSEGPFLICAPLSTLVNWEREFEFWAPDMYVVSYSGHRENRQVIRNYEMTFEEDAIKKGSKAYKVKKDSMVKFHVLLTSYELVSIDANTLQSIDWKVLVIDEAHRLKNNQSKFFRTMSSYHIGYTLLLTGTPLQNNLEELFHLLNFLCPNKFINRENFLAEFEDIGKEDQIKKLHEMLGPHMLRRLKSDVLKGIPTKSEFIVRIELSPMQQKYYKYILTKNFEALNARGSVQVSLLNIVMELKKCCNHPYLFSTAALEAPRLPNNAFEVKALTEASGKLVLLYKMLKKLETQGHRVLIFSQMTRVLDLLEDFMEGHAWKYERLDGTITGPIRQAAIDRFNQPNSGIFAFLLSTRAGGLGINLATADTVFIFDSDWNPHNDIQAFSRAHRIGQQNKVMIYRFVTKASVEERITQVAKKKMMLTHLVVRPGLGSKAAQAMSKRELDDILKFGTEQMFKDAADDTGRIVYDDKAVEALLDRSNEGILEKESGGMDEYLSSFKVANYTVKDKDEPDVEVLKQNADVIDNDYWEKLLRHHYEQEQEYIASTLGKGKRVRKQVNYNDGALAAEANKMLRGAYDDGSDFDASELVDDSDDLSDEDGSNLSVRQRKFRDRDMLPPLLAKVGAQIEVYGFNPRQRRAFLTAVMRYGLPPKTFKTAKDKWCIHNLRGKTEKAFQAYTSMFLRHLCEPGMDNKLEAYSDGVPREGVNRAQVLTRIGIMSLVRRKVEEYSSINTFLHPVLFGHITLQNRSMEKLVEEIKHANELNPVKTDTVNSRKESKKNEKNGEQKQASDETRNKIETNELEDKKKTSTPTENNGKISTSINENGSKTSSPVNENGSKTSSPVNENGSKISSPVNENGSKTSSPVNENRSKTSSPVNENASNTLSPAKAEDMKVKIEETEDDNVPIKEEVEKMEVDESANVTEKDKTEDCSSDDVNMKDDFSSDRLDDNLTNDSTKADVNLSNGEVPMEESGDSDKKESEKKNEVADEEVGDLKKDTNGTNNVPAISEKDSITAINETKTTAVAVAPNGDKKKDINGEAPALREVAIDVKAESNVVDGVTLPKFMFNIADGGFTELHVLWEAEEKRKLDNIWWRYHDYWLLAGVVVHGYGRWQDIQNDIRFDTINRPFARMSLDYKNKFIARRFKLLEQALIVEEQLKRATLMSVQQENPHPAMSLQSRFAELECLAESHQHLSKESLSGNKPANAVLHKVLNQLESLLSDMKNDVSRLPTALAKMPPVTHRLKMSERAVLTRLATGGQVAIDGTALQSPLAAQSPGVFTSPPAQGVVFQVKGQVISPPTVRSVAELNRPPVHHVIAPRPSDI